MGIIRPRAIGPATQGGIATEWKGKIEKLDEHRWMIPKGEVPQMLTDAVIYSNDELIKYVVQDESPRQVANVACLPGIVGNSLAMPDIHWGYGFPIGGVAAVDANQGSISPGGIGFDINCGVRLVKTDLQYEDVKDRMKPLMDALYKDIPSGLGSKGVTVLRDKVLPDILERGSEWAIENGFGWEKDLEVTEEGGRMKDADSETVGPKPRKRGLRELGSLGSGNHFLEVDVVDEVFDEATAKAYGLRKGQVTVTVHCGSRGCGHQIATDYLQEMERWLKENPVDIPDVQLACAPLTESIGERYYKAMCCGANFAWANRQMITDWARKAFEEVMGESAEDMGMDVVYDVAHNIAKMERHTVDRHSVDVLVHRKGATRAFAPGRAEVPLKYRDWGQPVIIPGDMATGTYVLAGRQGSMDQTFGSSCHGAGRRMSRKKAVASIDIRELRAEMAGKGIEVRSPTDGGLLEEAPQAYKDVAQVVDIVCGAGLTAKVAKLRPIGVVKGRGGKRPGRDPPGRPGLAASSRTSSPSRRGA